MTSFALASFIQHVIELKHTTIHARDFHPSSQPYLDAKANTLKKANNKPHRRTPVVTSDTAEFERAGRAPVARNDAVRDLCAVQRGVDARGADAPARCST